MNAANAISTARPSSAFSWLRLCRITGLAQGAGLVITAAALHDAEAAAVGVATIVATALLGFRSGRVGAVVLGLLFVDVGFFTGAAAITNLADRASPAVTIAPGVLAAIAVPGLAAAVAVVARGSRATVPSRLAGILPVVAGIALVALGAISFATGGGATPAGPEVLRLEVSGARFSQSELTATGRAVTVQITNHDLFWHTFTIADLGVDMKLPVGGDKEVTFTAAPGTYTYFCSVPGHSAFMHGVLIVR